jgi:hypothetical protein
MHMQDSLTYKNLAPLLNQWVEQHYGNLYRTRSCIQLKSSVYLTLDARIPIC